VCQGCVADGLITQIAYDFTEQFQERWPLSDYGPAHIVIADNNYEDENLQWCIDNIDNPKFFHREWEPGEREATLAMLKELLSWSRESRIGEKEL
jgi:hypothetical protein